MEGKTDRVQMKKGEALGAFLNKHIVGILGVLIGAVTFLCIYGVHVLDVTYTDWLLGGGDLTQNYLGWCFYRNSSWTFPIGLMDQIAYPNQVSVIFTDSIPLMAVFFKLFRGILPEEFQYFGIWGLMCFAAQGIFGSLLIYHYVKRKAEAIVGSLFFIITPVMLAQVTINLALGAQWLILCAVWLGLRRRELSAVQNAVRWGVLGILAAGSQLYFIPICGFAALSFLLSDLICRKDFRGMLAGLGSYIGTAVGTVALLGGFSHDHMPAANVLGQASFNLNGLFNAQGWSQIMEALPTYGVYAEDGLAFPGSGVVFTLAVGAAAWLLHVLYHTVIKREGMAALKRGRSAGPRRGENGIAYLILILLCLAVAVSPEVAWGSSVLASWEPPAWILDLWGRVESCGRFIWPVVYLVILASVVWMEKEMPWEAMAAVILMVLAVFQVTDGKWQLMQRQVQFGTDYVYYSPLQDEKWEIWAEDENIRHMVFVSYLVEDEEMMYELSAYAAQSGMSVNDFSFACQTIRLAAADELLDSLTKVRDDTLYIYAAEDADMCITPGMEYTEVDGLIVGTAQTGQNGRSE